MFSVLLRVLRVNDYHTSPKAPSINSNAASVNPPGKGAGVGRSFASPNQMKRFIPQINMKTTLSAKPETLSINRNRFGWATPRSTKANTS